MKRKLFTQTLFLFLLLFTAVTGFSRLTSPFSDSTFTGGRKEGLDKHPACTPTITITTALSSALCPGIPVTYTAAITNGGTTPAWQWMKNGLPAGTNSPTFFDQTAAGDEVYCILTSNDACASVTVVNSNIISIPGPGIINTIAGNGILAFAGDGGAATQASLNFPIDLTLDAAGNIYIADASNHRIRKIEKSTGVITTVAGSGAPGFSGDGGPATTAQLNNPTSMAFDAPGNLYIVDRNNHRIRKVNASTGIITTIAGNGTAGFGGDNGPALNALLKFPLHVLTDVAGNVYFTDRENNRVRKIAAGSGVITTIAGTGRNAFSGDGGPATAADLFNPTKIVFDRSGNLVIADWGNHRVRKINTSGIISTIAGTGTQGSSGDGGPATAAQLSFPTGICYDASGNLHIADVNHVIRKVNAANGIIEKMAGAATVPGFAGDGGVAVDARLNGPSGMSFDADGHLLLCDYLNHRIRKISVSNLPATAPVVTASSTTVCTASGSTTLSIASGSLNGAKEWRWYAGSCGNTLVGTGHSITVSPTATTTYTVRGEGNCAAQGPCSSITISVETAIMPAVSISPATALYCFGISPQFTVTATNTGTNPAYQWKKNGVALPNANATVLFIPVAVNDVIICELTTTNNCGNTVTVASNSVTIQSNPGYNKEPEVTIAATAENICNGTLVTFTATNVSQSASPVYQWLVNGSPLGTNSATFSTNTLQNGAKVECIMTVPHCNGNGTTKDYSNTITMNVQQQQNPKVSISPVAVAICKGVPVSFTAKAENAGANPSFQWKVNNLPVGTNSTTFTSTSFKDGDLVTCQVTIDPAVASCTNGTAAVSNGVTLTVSDIFTPTLTIAASKEEICEGIAVTFTATGVDAGPQPAYQWQINGGNVGTNSTQFTTTGLKNSDKVSCVLTPANSCGSRDVSDAITITVHPNPDARFVPSTLVAEPGKQVLLTPVVQGTISYHEWNPASQLTNPSMLTPLTKPMDQTTTFRLLVQTAEGCKDTASITINVYNKLYMPDSFTPNGDGKNDIFRIPAGALVKLKEFSVFDRWGNRVFSTTDSTRGWDGKRKGTGATADTYVYIVSGQDNKGEVFVKGTVQLIR